MKQTPQQWGSYRLQAADVTAAKARARAEAPINTTCGCGWESNVATLDEGHALYEAHRADVHPERRDRGQKERARAAKAAPKAVAIFGDSDL